MMNQGVSMKRMTGIFYVLALASISAPALATELKCGHSVVIPSEFVSDLRDPACIALDRRADLAVVSGDTDSGLVMKAIRLDRSGRARDVVRTLTKEEAQEETTPFYAMSRSCGLALITARIVDEKEVLLIFDNLTVIRWHWDSPNPRLVALATNFDPEGGYLCYGIEAGIDTHAELIDFDRGAGTLTVRDEYRGSVTVRF
jgi:hypothetical protein